MKVGHVLVWMAHTEKAQFIFILLEYNVVTVIYTCSNGGVSGSECLVVAEGDGVGPNLSVCFM